jgi:hypothetical protein
MQVSRSARAERGAPKAAKPAYLKKLVNLLGQNNAARSDHEGGADS